MNQFYFITTLFFALFFNNIFAQEFTISGTIKDAQSGEDLIGANVLVVDLPGTGTISNEYGFYSLTLAEGTYTIRVQYLGYDALDQQVILTENKKLDIELGEAATKLNEIVISGEKENVNVTRTEMSVFKVNPKQIESIPVLFGERDIVKTLQLTPGINSAGEGNAGFYVRGGGIDQNLILLDEAPVYNASHLLGFFSVFNSDAIKDVTLYKGGMSAKYGGRASSVMDIIMKDGNKKKFSASGGIGLIASRLTVEGPLIKDKSSFILSGRRTYADVFLAFSNDEQIKDSRLYFYDLNTKINFKLSEKDRLFISGYFGRDKFGFGDDFGFDWGNATGTIRWNHVFGEKVFSNTSLIYSDYDYAFGIGGDGLNFNLSASIQDWNFKEDLTWFISNEQTLKFGAQIIYHTFEPGKFEVGGDTNFNSFILPEQYGLESGVYVQSEQKLGGRASFNFGLRLSSFQFLGNGNAVNTFDIDGGITETQTYEKNEIVQSYVGYEPRASFNFQLNEFSSLKASYNRNFQYIHLLSNTTTSSPTDLWIPSTNNVKPQIANQFSMGYFRNFNNNQYEFSVEGYYKTLQNQIDYKTGANLFLNELIEADLLYGEGLAYGLEFFLQKKTGKFTGWLGYTLSRSVRKFKQINEGEIYPARQDRIHDVSIVGLYDLSNKIKLSASFVFYTGDAATFPAGAYTIGGSKDFAEASAVNGSLSAPAYTQRNGYYFPSYHRADVGLSWLLKQKKNYESSLNFSIYNLYARENAFTISFQPTEDDPEVNEAIKLALFKTIPSISWDFKF